MKRIFIWLTVMVLTGPAIVAQERVPEEIQNPAITQIGKLPPRGNAWSHPDAESAKNSRYGESPWVKSLNGRWKFHWSPRPEQRPLKFYEQHFETRDWAEIPVPSTWEREGVDSKVGHAYPSWFGVLWIRGGNRRK